ncbi:RHS repeat-associated core domain-containing protein [Akkermansiaceae bacterium]|nr:RHS repeat-associated core domain-containing protein [Akkermansiaceae bacterium]
MKPTAILALFLAFLAAIPAPGQQQGDTTGSEKTYNQDPDLCCECIKMKTERQKPDTKGNVPVIVTVTHTGATDCPDSVDFTVSAHGLDAPAAVPDQDGTVAAGQSVTLTFLITPDQNRTCEEWEFTLTCEKSDSYCDRQIVTLRPCGGDDSCSDCDGESAEPSASQPEGPGNFASGDGPSSSLQDDDVTFSATFPTTRSNGGMSDGSMRFVSRDFTFPGRAGLITNFSPDFDTTNSLGGILSKVQTKAGLAEVEVTDGPGQNAFTVTHRDPVGFAFRTTVISWLTAGGEQTLRMDSTYDGTTTRHEQTQPQPGTLVLKKGRVIDNEFVPLLTDTLVKTESNGLRTYHRTVETRASGSHAWHTVSDTETTWEKQIFGWMKTKEVIHPGGAALTSTWTYYQPGDFPPPEVGVSPGGFELDRAVGRVRHFIRYDGYEAFYTYSLFSRSVTTPYAGNPAGKTTTSSWDAATMTQTITTRVGNHIISKTVRKHGPGSTMTVDEYTSEGTKLTTTHFYKESNIDFGGKSARAVHPDGTLTTYSYTRNAGGGYTTVTDNGQANTAKTAVTKGTRTTTTRNSRGTVILSKTEAIGYTGAAGLYSSMAVTEVDNLGRALTTAHHSAGPSAGPSDEQATAPFPAYNTYTAYSCCGVSKEIDMYGVKTFHAYDGLRRRVKSNTLGVTIETVYDGLTTETHRYAEEIDTSLSSALTDNDINLVSSSYRNLSGTLSESGSPDPTPDPVPPLAPGVPRPLVITKSEITYKPAAGLSMREVTTTPDNFSQTTDSFLDGRPYKTYGSLSPEMEYAYSTNPTGQIDTRSYLDGTALRETTTSQSDWAGRTLRLDYMGGAYATMTYNSLGQMTKSTDPDGIATLYEYNTRGERTVSAIDLDGNGAVTYGTDTVQFSETVPATGTIGTTGTIASYSGPVWKSVSKVWQDGQADSATGTTVSTSIRSANGLHSSTESIGVASPSISATALAGNGEWIVESKNPDGSKSVASYEAGLLRSTAVRDSSNALVDSVTYGYDSLNRTISQTDLRRGSITALPSNYLPGAYTSILTTYLSDTADYVKSTGEPVNLLTKYTYDIRGRRITVDAPDTTDADGAPLANITNTLYNPDSTVQETNGAQTYRTTHTYDYADRMTTLTTYGTATATTTWTYSPDRGFLTRKQYADSTGTNYTYTAAGRLATRTSARGLLTVYTYEKGRLVNVDYWKGEALRGSYLQALADKAAILNNPNSTQQQIDDAVAAAAAAYTAAKDPTPDVAIAYDALNRPTTQSNGLATSAFTYSSTLAPDTETITYNLPGQTAFTRVIDRSRDNLNRPSGWKYGTAAQYAAGWEQSGSPDLENQAAYGYDTAGRLSTVSGGGLNPPSQFTYGYEPNSYGMLRSVTGPAHTVTNTWNQYRNILQSKENEAGTTNISTFAYGVNSIGQRDSLTTTGSGFDGGNNFASATATGPAYGWSYNARGELVEASDTSTANNDRAYEYDGIGNRKKTVDGLFADLGTAPVNYTANALNQYTAVPSVASAPTYDPDGNATSYPVPKNPSANSTLTWDAENRLITATVNGTTTTYRYDAASRRIATTTGGSTVTVIYDGWNPIAKYAGTTLVESYLWGMDLSGSMQGAGGVGGLLAVNDGSASYYPTYDGNGNVSEYLDSAGAVAAHYEYDPFGNTTVATGAKAADFSHRFSTKPLDAETGLYYYGYRYYDPVTGRWPSRDPIGERGGLNLYGFVENDGVNYLDRLGLIECPVNCSGAKLGVMKGELGGFFHDRRDIDNVIENWNPGDGPTNGVSMEISFDGKPNPGEGECCFDSFMFIQIVKTNAGQQIDETKEGFALDGNSRSNPGYPSVPGNKYPEGHPREGQPFGGMIDAPNRPDYWLEGFEGKDINWRAWTFVVGFKNGSAKYGDHHKGTVLLQGIEWGFDRLWNKTSGSWGSADPFGPKCIESLGANGVPTSQQIADAISAGGRNGNGGQGYTGHQGP